MKIIYMSILTLCLSFFLFHERTFSPAGQMASADQATAQTSMVIDLEKLAISRPAQAFIDIPAMGQLPELYNGCEVTSLSMLLAAEGIKVKNVVLAQQIKKDLTTFRGTSLVNISQWGDPNDGFVGDITGNQKGYGVYNGPLFDLLSSYAPHRAVNLTGSTFSVIEWMINKGNPVIVWTTTNYRPTEEWVSWKKGNHTVKATLKEHVVLLVGYDGQYVYANDPLTGEKSHKIEKKGFLESWRQMGSQAVSSFIEPASLLTTERSKQN